MSTIKQRYVKLKAKREPFLTRAEKAAKITIPSLIPSEGATSTTSFEPPYQSLGAKGVNHLAAKLRLLLLPPNSPFFRFKPNNILLQQEQAMLLMEGRQEEAEALKTELEQNLAELENTLLNEIEATEDGAVLNEAFKHLLVAGNVLLVDRPDKGLKYYPLSRYVINRDYSGNVLEIITEEKVSKEVLGEEIEDEIREGGGKAKDDELTLYTYVKRNNSDQWEISQEIDGVVIERTKGIYPLDRSPFIPLRYTRLDGEDYGRGFIEDLYGDLYALNQLSKAIQEGSLSAAKLIFMVNPNSTTRKQDITEAANCAVIDGDANEVSTLQAAKTYDFATAKEEVMRLTRELSFMFLLNSAVQRDAERVKLPLRAVMLYSKSCELGETPNRTIPSLAYK